MLTRDVEHAFWQISVLAWRHQYIASFTSVRIYSVEMQDLNTNTNQTGLLLVFDFWSDSERTLTKNFCEYLQVFKVFIIVVHSHILHASILLSCFDLQVLMVIHAQQAL